MVTFVVGGRDGGKTSRFKELFRRVDGAAGFISAKVLDGGKRSGYDIVDLITAKRTPLARTKNAPLPKGWISYRDHGIFRFSEAGFLAAAKIIDKAIAKGASALFIDELGKLEIGGEGLSAVIEKARDSGIDLYLAIRDINVEKAVAVFGFREYETIEVE